MIKLYLFSFICSLPLGLLAEGLKPEISALYRQDVIIHQNAEDGNQKKDRGRKFLEAGKYLQKIRARDKLIVAMTEMDRSPFYYITATDSLVGLDVDIAKRLTNSLQVTLQIDRSAESSEELISLLESGKADIAISRFSRTLPRSQTSSL